MAKSISGVKQRKGKTVSIGDNRYGMREAYDSDVAASTKRYYKRGDTLTVREVKNPLSRSVKVTKP